MKALFDKFKSFLSSKKENKVYADCIIRNEQGQLLLLQRSYQDDFQPGKWCIPGGKIERGEFPEYAAARELLEETNIQVPLEFIQVVEHEDGSASFYFQGVVHTQQFPILDNSEHYRLEWVNIDEIAKYDLILDLKDILMNKVGLPVYFTKLMELEVFDMNDLFKRNEVVEKAFNADKISVEEYFTYKSMLERGKDVLGAKEEE